MQFGSDFDALVGRFSPDPNQTIALAVSGGSDSVALLHLAHDWSKKTGRSLHVLTVDHGLRAEAREEADWVADLSGRLGHSHEILTWTDARPSQNAARKARYRLLSIAARRVGAGLLLTGHTGDDVVETALIRRRRGVRGGSEVGPALASPVPVWPEGHEVTVLRPLIYSTRQDLRRFLDARDQIWREDPSNEEPAFERVRVRQFLARHPALMTLATRSVTRLQIERQEQDEAVVTWLEKCHVQSDGLIEVKQQTIPPRALAILARCASGTDRMTRLEAVCDLARSLNCPGQRQTLGGAWFQRTQDGFRIGRDPGEARSDIEADLFDGRFVADPAGRAPTPDAQAFLVRHAAPPGSNWREIISERLAHVSRCYQTPRLIPVQT